MHIHLRNVFDESKAYAQGTKSAVEAGGSTTAGSSGTAAVPLSINNPAATLTSTKATIGIKMKLKVAGGLSSFSIGYLKKSETDATQPTIEFVDDRSPAAKTLKIKDIPSLEDDCLVFIVSSDLLKVLAGQPQNKDATLYLTAPADTPLFSAWVAEAAEHQVAKKKEREQAAELKKEAALAAGKKRERSETDASGNPVSKSAVTSPTASTVAETVGLVSNNAEHGSESDENDDDEDWDDEDGDWDDEDDEEWEDENVSDGSDADENPAELQLLLDTIDSFALSLKGVQMLDKLLNLPNIDDLWAKFQTDPTAVMQEVQQSSPELFQLVAENHEEFLKIMEMRRKIKEDGLNVAHMMPGDEGDTGDVEPEDISDAEVTVRLRELVNIYKEEGVPSADGLTVTDMEGNVISSAQDGDMIDLGSLNPSAVAALTPLTPEDEEKISSLMSLGAFTRDQCERALRRCDKNIERAASFLFENYTD